MACYFSRKTAVGTIGDNTQCEVQALTSDRPVRLVDIDKHLGSHAVFDFRWKLKQNVFSCRSRFMGGVPEGRRAIIYGDQLLTISPNANARLLN